MFNKYRQIKLFTKLAILLTANIVLFLATQNIGTPLGETGYFLLTLTAISILVDVIIVHTSHILNLAVVAYVISIILGIYFLLPVFLEGLYVEYEEFLLTIIAMYTGFSVLTATFSILIARGKLWVNMFVTQTILTLSLLAFSIEFEKRGMEVFLITAATALGLSLLFLYFRQPSKKQKQKLVDSTEAPSEAGVELKTLQKRLDKLSGIVGEKRKATQKFPYLLYSFPTHKLVVLPSYSPQVLPVALESVVSELKSEDRKAKHIYTVNAPASTYPVAERRLYKWKQPNSLLTVFYQLNREGQERMITRLLKQEVSTK